MSEGDEATSDGVDEEEEEGEEWAGLSEKSAVDETVVESTAGKPVPGTVPIPNNILTCLSKQIPQVRAKYPFI